MGHISGVEASDLLKRLSEQTVVGAAVGLLDGVAGTAIAAAAPFTPFPRSMFSPQVSKDVRFCSGHASFVSRYFCRVRTR